MDGVGHASHYAPVRVLPHIKRLDDCFGQFLVRVICGCGACREIEPERLVGLSAASERHHRSVYSWFVHRVDTRHDPALPERLARLVSCLSCLFVSGTYPAAGWGGYCGRQVSVRPHLHYFVTHSAAGDQ